MCDDFEDLLCQHLYKHEHDKQIPVDAPGSTREMVLEVLEQREAHPERGTGDSTAKG